jgi:hypothetical protein
MIDWLLQLYRNPTYARLFVAPVLVASSAPSGSGETKPAACAPMPSSAWAPRPSST